MALPKCSFCDKLRQGSNASATNPWDQQIFSTVGCVAMPTKGAMVPGWMLVSPRKHFISLGAMDDPLFEEFDGIVEDVVNAVEDNFGPTVCFEHGPACDGRPVGCGVDHAHLHIVPTSFDLLSKVNTIFPDTLTWRKVAGLRATRVAAAQGHSYLYYRSPAEGSVIATHPEFGSQLFRRAVALCLGRPNRFDWRDDPETSIVELTVAKLENWKRSSSSHLFSVV